jgi:hypothetical protein
LRISLALNAATPTELADCCPFVEQVYAVEYTDFVRGSGDPEAALAGVPRDWDYVLDDARSEQAAQQQFVGLRRYYAASRCHFRARVAHGFTGTEPPAYAPHGQLRLELPARRELGAAVSIAVLPAGSSERSRYPSPRSWELILRALADALSGAVFCFVGKLARDRRTATSLARGDFDRLIAAVPHAVDCVDQPILEQLAFVEACDLFVSPHTGFGCAALAVGTPWLCLSGGPWHEWLFNGVPFYSVLPDTERFPCFTWMDRAPPLVDDDGPRTSSMSRARIEQDLPELLDAARLLVERRQPYEDALARYFPRLLGAYGGDRSRVFSFDRIHERYI